MQLRKLLFNHLNINYVVTMINEIIHNDLYFLIFTTLSRLNDMLNIVIFVDEICEGISMIKYLQFLLSAVERRKSTKILSS